MRQAVAAIARCRAAVAQRADCAFGSNPPYEVYYGAPLAPRTTSGSPVS
jgi:hypothetical protein